MMRVALIPPISRLSDTNTYKTNIQLCLPHLLNSRVYKEIYATHCADPDQLVILDNGAAEGETVTDRGLAMVASEIRPQELALPDVLGDAYATWERSEHFLREYKNYLNEIGVAPGFVLQGPTIKEAQDVFQRVVDSVLFDTVETIFLPRSLVRTAGREARLKLAQWINEFEYDFDIHFFGASPLWPQELMDVEGVRSIDTSLPYNYALAGELLFDTTTAEVGRVDNYFDLPYKVFPKLSTALNIHAYLRWAR